MTTYSYSEMCNIAGVRECRVISIGSMGEMLHLVEKHKSQTQFTTYTFGTITAEDRLPITK